MRATLILKATFTAGLLALAVPVSAQDEPSRLRDGSYVVLLGSQLSPDGDSALDGGQGGQLQIGVRRGWYAIEAGGVYSEAGDAQQLGGNISALLFPFSGGALSGLYGVLGVGALEVKDYPGLSQNYDVTTSEAGLGYLLPLRIGRYEFGIRGDARWRYARREKELNLQQQDLPIPRSFKDQVYTLGLHLPLGFTAPAVRDAPEAVEVVPVETTLTPVAPEALDPVAPDVLEPEAVPQDPTP